PGRQRGENAAHQSPADVQRAGLARADAGRRPRHQHGAAPGAGKPAPAPEPAARAPGSRAGGPGRRAPPHGRKPAQRPGPAAVRRQAPEHHEARPRLRCLARSRNPARLAGAARRRQRPGLRARRLHHRHRPQNPAQSRRFARGHRTLILQARAGHAAATPHSARPSSPAMTRLFIVDDHAVLRNGLHALLSQEPDIELVGAAANGQELLDQLPDVPTDVVLL
nr:hypothetical protein [Tanacetum cinerariifolium]